MRGNLANEAARMNEVGQCWEEVVSGGGTTAYEVPKFHSVRIRAVNPGLVKIDGVNAATMIAGEVIIFNSGNGIPDDNKETVRMEFPAGSFVQVGRQMNRRP